MFSTKIYLLVLIKYIFYLQTQTKTRVEYKRFGNLEFRIQGNVFC